MLIRRSTLFAVLPALLAGMGSMEARAYIPPSEYVLKKVLQKRLPLKNVRLRGMVAGLRPDGRSTGTRFVEETFYDAASRTLHSSAFDETGRELYSVERNLGGGGEAGEPRALVWATLFEARFSNFLPLLRKWDIPVKLESELLKLADEPERRAVEKMHLGRQKLASGFQVSWVLGETSSNQLWIEKDSFVPSRLIFKSGDGSDLRIDEYSSTKEIPTPRTMTLSRGSEQLLREEIQDANVNLPAPPAMARGRAGGFTDAGNAADRETRDLILRYYRILR